MKQTTIFTLITVFFLIPGTLLLGTRLPGRWYYLTSTLMICEAMLPFFFSFEARKPKARELVTISVMAALATASRVVFAFVPQFKPITGIIMISGIAFGPQAGFLTGAVAAFASNFFFSQGPWTPWQMIAYGFGGFLAGVIFRNHRNWCKGFILAPFGFLTIMLFVGPILDTCTVFTMLSKLSLQSALLIYGQGVLNNIPHAIACALTLALLARPLLYKLDRLMNKYGMLEFESFKI